MSPDQQQEPDGKEPVQRGDSGPLSHAELDALVASLDSPGGSSSPESTPEALESTSVEPSPPSAPPEPDSVALEHTVASQSELDRLLGEDSEQPLVDRDLDEVLPEGRTRGSAPLHAPPPASHDSKSRSVDQEEIDALLATLGTGPGPSTQTRPVPAEGGAEAPDSAITQDILDALIGVGDESAAVSGENLAAAVAPEMANDVGISQDLLDSLIEDARGSAPPELESSRPAQREASQPTPDMEPTLEEAAARLGIAAPPRESDSKPLITEAAPAGLDPSPLLRDRTRRLRSRINLLKAAWSLVAGVLLAFGSYVFLSRHREVTPSVETLMAAHPLDLDTATAIAREKLAAGSYREAAAVLDAPIKAAPDSPARTDAVYLRIEARVKPFVQPARMPALPVEAAVPEATGDPAVESPGRAMEALHSDIDAIVKAHPNDPRVVDALRWKARLYERQNNATEARRVYTETLEKYGASPNIDQVLMDAAKLALSTRTPEESIGHLTRLIEGLPGSPLVGEAKLLLGDAYAAAGDPAAARREYISIAQAQPDTALGAEAFIHLGKLALDRGEYTEAIQHFETRLSTATSVKGNEPVYLLLARSYRAAGRMKDAERVLRELLDFFEPSEVTPSAYVQLSQVMEAQGQRDEAKRLAGLAALRYPDNPEVLTHQGMLLGQTGEYAQAAQALMAADAAGADNPDVLMEAGRNFRRADQLKDARAAYERLLEAHGSQPQAFQGGIELAQTQYGLGQVRLSLQRLEDLVTAAAGKPQRLPALIALGNLYQDLRLYPRAADIHRQVAALTTEPEVLAQAAVALWSAGEWVDAAAVAKRVDLSKLSNQTAYAFLTKQGEALLRADSNQALEKMEQAYSSFPEERTPEGDQKLLAAYLTTDRSARARALVMELEALARQKPIERLRLERAAAAWGDYLYRRGDYRAAADAYALAVPGAAAPAFAEAGPEAQWAAFQQANALLQLADYSGSAAMFEKIASSTAPWAEDARMKADYAKLEQRLRATRESESPPPAAESESPAL